MSEADVGPFYFIGSDGFEAWGFAFPSGFTVLEWRRDRLPAGVSQLDEAHQSIYGSVDDLLQAAEGRIHWGFHPDNFPIEEAVDA